MVYETVSGLIETPVGKYHFSKTQVLGVCVIRKKICQQDSGVTIFLTIGNMLR